MSRFMVLGGHGFIGEYVCRAFHETDVDVVAVGRAFKDVPYKQIVADLTDVSQIDDLFMPGDTVVCLASTSLPASSNESVSDEVSSHVHRTLILAEKAAFAGAEKFIFSSSGGTVYGQNSGRLSENSNTHPISAYGVSKLAIEHYLRILEAEMGMRTISLRIANPYGHGQMSNKGQGFIAAALHAIVEGKPLTIWGDGSSIRDYLHVKDVARSIVKASYYDGVEPVFNIGSEIGISLLDLIDKIETIFECKLDVRFDDKRTVDVAENVLCAKLAENELGWRSEISLEEGLAEIAGDLVIENILAA